jgi:transcriptional regulator with XRE-family HTH domain
LAKKLKKPQSYVSKYERGERRLDVVEFLDIAKALGTDEHEIIRKVAASPK